MISRKQLYYCLSSISIFGILSILIRCKERPPLNNSPNNYITYTFDVPRDQKPDDPFTYLFSVKWIEKLIRKKKQIKITLDGDRSTNQKKLELVKYEARKLKYTEDTTTVIRINLTNETTYGEFIQLVKLCNNDKHKRYALLKRSFIIFGEYRPEKPDTTKRIQPIYL